LVKLILPVEQVFLISSLS